MRVRKSRKAFTSHQYTLFIDYREKQRN